MATSRLVFRLPALALLVALATLVSAVAPTAPALAASSEPTSDEATFETITELDELTSDHAKIFRLYWAFFNRQPDPGGALYWIAQRDRCLGLDAIADWFARSDEFETRYGSLDDGEFVELIYHNVLERAGDEDGLAYWTGLLTDDVLSRGEVVLHVSLSSELAARHPYPSDDVPPRSCHLPDGRPTGRSVHVLDGEPLATVAGLTLRVPAAVIEWAGFHQSSHPGALAMTAVDPAPVRLTTMASRNRGTNRQGAIDIVSEPTTAITAPVTGTVARAGNYTLYCKYRDGYVVINPDGRPDLEVKILHIQGVMVRAGQRVESGQLIAAHATTFPFRSQIDALTAEPSWPHVHIEVVDPSVPRKPSSGSC
jgi:biotin carboxyl carrier protein